MKKLYRSETNKVWKGVLGGIGEYFDVDPVLVRVIFLLLCIVSAFVPAVIAYIIAVVIIPLKPTTPAA